ncbi:MAG: signal peptide peptidase SppA [Candidatus Tisiphia sp.]|jgi:protease-4|uniref:signal peptide peptidase SppA n=1 Tax=Candidatus Tisiphia endosymbiont of Melanophora roralis TaxID=3066261 RepID=UPI001E72BB4C|nr:MAG: signal peptide peptidase SppA [Rickettsia endosymbiont of Cimex lectularius]
MTITPDYIIERKQNKLKLRLWKLATILMFIVLIVVMIKKFDLSSSEYVTTNSNYIAAVSIEDIIFEDTKRDKRLEKIIDDDKINALIVNVNSPGGTVVGSEKIYNILRKISAKKPVVIVMGTLAASGGYLISLGGDYIISHNGTITGSIGVILQTLEVTDLAKTLGITFNNFKSGELKAAPNPTEKVTEAVRQAIMSNVQDTYDYFIELVALRRGLAIEEVKKIADGRIYSGRQALKLKLVDALGSEDDAIKWLQEVKKIDKDLKVKEFKIKPKSKFLEIIMEDFDSVLPSFFKNKFQGIKAIF